jgi:hypothetical protein
MNYVPADLMIIPWGDWIQQILALSTTALIPLVLAMVAYATKLVPDSLKPFVMMLRSEQIITRAVQSAIASVDGAVSGKKATVEVTNAILLQAMEFVMTNGSTAMIKFIGDDVNMLVQKLLARMHEEGVVPAEFSLDKADHAVDAWFEDKKAA